MAKSFIQHYLATVVANLKNDHADNFDRRRFGAERPIARNLRTKLSHAMDLTAAGFGWIREKRVQHLAGVGFDHKEGWVEGMSWLYDHLADEASKNLLVQVLAYRALGHRHVMLPNNNPTHWARIEALERMQQGSPTTSTGPGGRSIHQYDLNGIGFPVKLFGGPVGLEALYQQQQYRYPLVKGAVEAEPGDVAIDAGGCWGDSALYFAHLVGPTGRVISFEFMPDNLAVFEQNLALNPDIAQRITVARNPVWSVSDADLFISGTGPGTTVSPEPKAPDAKAVKTLTIDDMVTRTGTARIDFIKMDIEGAEMQALEGARQTIQRFEPKIAICVYHDLSDFWTVPQFIASLGLDYEFYFGHFTPHAEESVVFGKPRA
ncbi:MAG: FkbM family methyltransferase [Flavobacteriales bacterium]|nr:FkbM family methyltransferase [Flavobacteriales bacterium]MBK7754500.1 FkbM family methyltransferase [Flavobacteriales bacterium]MBK9075779.1 FkbM family methyltransferase [Flavobacteriales bacterium]